MQFDSNFCFQIKMFEILKEVIGLIIVLEEVKICSLNNKRYGVLLPLKFLKIDNKRGY